VSDRKRILILAEGETEMSFVKRVLTPAFSALSVSITARELITKKVKHGPHFRGGVTTWGKLRNDLVRLLAEARGVHLVTTLIDYYGLPTDTPGMSTRPNGSPENRVRHVEKQIAAVLDNPRNFLPFLALHELEAWLFSKPDEIARAATQKDRGEMAAIRAEVSTPEEINDGRETAPSKRILRVFPAWKKALHGTIAAERIGIEVMRAECPHFATWVENLEKYAETKMPA
jgi:hypothetical protein